MKTAVVDYQKDRSITYEDLERLSSYVSYNIENKPKLIWLNLKNSIEFVCCYYGIIFSDHICVFSKPDTEHFEININNVYDVLKESPKTEFKINPDAYAFMMQSSGSTGAPKETYYTHKKRNLILQKMNPEERVLITTPFSHMNGLSNMEIALHSRQTIYIAEKFVASDALSCIKTRRITKLTGVPSVYEMLCSTGGVINSVRTIRVASSILKPETLAKIKTKFVNATIHNSYGISEVGPGLFRHHPNGIKTPDLSVGYPAEGYEYKIVDGILFIKTPLMSEFFNTKDLFEVDDAGFYYCKGRADDVFKCGGYTVNPIEIEIEIEKLDGVERAIVIPVADAIKENKPICIIICSIETDDINSQLNLAEYKKPRKYIKVDTLPMTAVGKVDRKKLKRDYE